MSEIKNNHLTAILTTKVQLKKKYYRRDLRWQVSTKENILAFHSFVWINSIFSL